nr:MAG TPA: hypothetical protein [Caudoviricetes sp.]
MLLFHFLQRQDFLARCSSVNPLFYSCMVYSYFLTFSRSCVR